MDATSFELNVQVPADARFTETIRDLAVHAARYAGCHERDADAYGAAVEAAVRGCLTHTAAGSPVPVVVRRGAGPLECLIASARRFELAPASDPHITIGWVENAGRPVCRVARSMLVDV